MKSLNFKMILGVMALSVFTLSGCASKEGPTNAAAAIPADVDAFIYLDLDKAGQRDAFKSIASKFPESELLSELWEEEVNSGFEYIYEGAWDDVIEVFGDVQFAMGVKADGFDFNNAEQSVYMALYIDDQDLFERLMLEGSDLNEEDLVVDEDLDVENWELFYNGEYTFRYGNVVTLSYDEEVHEELKQQLIEERPAFELPEMEGFAYVEMDIEAFEFSVMDLFANTLGYLETDYQIELFDAMEFLAIEVIAEDDGIRFEEKVEFVDGTDFVALGMVEEGQSYLFREKIPVGNPILYYEIPDASILFVSAFQSYYAEQARVYSTEEGIAYFSPQYDASLIEGDYVELGFAGLADVFGVDEEDLRTFVSSPAAMEFSYQESYLPSISVYMQIDEEDLEVAERVEQRLDGFVDEVMQSLAEELGAEGSEVAELIKREAVVVDGAGLHKVYLDWESAPEDIIARSAAVPNLTEEKVEFYYGLTADNIFVMSFYPSFDEAYSKDIIENDEVFADASGYVDLDSGSVSFFDMAPLFDQLDVYINFAAGLGGIGKQELAEYKEVVDWLKTMKFIVSRAKIEGDDLYQEAFIKFE